MQRQDGRKYEKTENEKILSLLAAGVLLLMSMSGCGKKLRQGNPGGYDREVHGERLF